MSITVCNFTNVYENQPFMEGLRLSGEATWINCTDIPGTDCYCDDEAVETIRRRIADADIKDADGIHFFDNGNYHYMSKIWTDMVQEPFSLVVFDHHPDMQEPRFGNILSCGGWVKNVLGENKFVNNVVIIGVADHLVDEIRAELSQAGDAEILDKVTFIRESELSSSSHPIPQSSRRLRPHTPYLYRHRHRASCGRPGRNDVHANSSRDNTCGVTRDSRSSRSRRCLPYPKATEGCDPIPQRERSDRPHTPYPISLSAVPFRLPRRPPRLRPRKQSRMVRRRKQCRRHVRTKQSASRGAAPAGTGMPRCNRTTLPDGGDCRQGVREGDGEVREPF